VTSVVSRANPQRNDLGSTERIAPDVNIKPMFGNLGEFVNGNMFMGLFGSDIGVELSSVT
jgi:hypothetical protein